MTNSRGLLCFIVLADLLLSMATTTNPQISSITVSPAIITTGTKFNVSVNSNGNGFVAYRYSFGSLQIETDKNHMTHQFYLTGKYELIVAGLLNTTWVKFAKREIQVFDHDTVFRSNCSIDIVPFLIPCDKKTAQGYLEYTINVTLTGCFGVCKVYCNSSTYGRVVMQSFLSHGKISSHEVKLNATVCHEDNVYFEITKINDVINSKVNTKSLPRSSRCSAENDSNGTSNASSIVSTSEASFNYTKYFTRSQNTTSVPTSTTIKVYGTLNIVVAVFFAVILGFYLLITFVAFLENKKSLKTALNLTNFHDEFLYEVQFHIGSAFSAESTLCEIQFTVYGTRSTIGPVSLPVSSFHHDGIVSFLISSNESVGEVGTIGVFCKDINLRCDWYLRKVVIFSHSERPSGNIWGDNDVIKSMAEFECHTWFQPAVKTASVAQVFHANTTGNEISLLMDYLKRCHQLFSQKHILTSWRCSFGVKSFSKTQRLSFLYTLWFVIICMSSAYLVENNISEAPQTEHRYHLGIVRIDKAAIDFAFTRGISAYVIGIIAFFVVKVLNGQANVKDSMRPDHIDTSGRKIYGIADTASSSVTNEHDCFEMNDARKGKGFCNDGLDADMKGELKANVGHENSRLASQSDMIAEMEFKANDKYKPANEERNSFTTKGFLDDSETISFNLNDVVIDLDNFTDKKESAGIEKSKEPVYEEEHQQNNVFVNENEADQDFIEVHFFSREILSSGKQNQWKKLLLKLSGRIFWIAFTILLMTCVIYTLVHSTSWSHDVAYHWLSYHILAVLVSCVFIDTGRVMLYILFITLKERKRLKSRMNRLSICEYSELLLASKLATKERDEFLRKEYPEDKMRFAQDHYRLRGKLRDLNVLSIFVICLLILTAWTVEKDSYQLSQTLANDLFHLYDLHEMQTDNTKVDHIAKYWEWLENTLLAVIDPSKRDVSLRGYYLVERGLRIVQKRVIPGKCNVAATMKNIVEECSLTFDKDSEDFKSYSPGWKAPQSGYIYGNSTNAWEYKGVQKSPNIEPRESPSLRGYTAAFHLANAKQTIDELKNHNWIDKYTRLLYLDTFVYDPAVNLMSQVLIEIEFMMSGYVRLETSFYNFKLFPELSPHHEFVQLAESVFFALTIYFAFDILKKKRRTSLSWISLWLFVQTVLVILSFATLSLYFYKNYNVFLLTLESTSEAEKEDIVRSIVLTQFALQIVLAMLNICALLFLTKPLFTLGLFDDMYTAVCRTLKDTKGIAMETVVLIIALGCWGNLAFCADISSFSSLRTTFPTLMDMLVRPDNSELYEIAFFGAAYLCTYFFIMILIVTNIFISSVETSYSEAREIIDQVAREFVLKLIFKKVKKKRLLQQKDLSLKSATTRKKERKFHARMRQGKELEEDNEGNIVENETQTTKPDEKEAENDGVVSSLESSVAKLEGVISKKIICEHIEDKILVSTINDKWDMIVLQRPPLGVISMYKPLIRS